MDKVSVKRRLAVMVMTTLLPCALMAGQGDSGNLQGPQVRATVEGVNAVPAPKGVMTADTLALASSATTVDREENAGLQTLQGVAPFADNAAGMCEVVNGILGEYCSANPDDISCQAVLQ